MEESFFHDPRSSISWNRFLSSLKFFGLWESDASSTVSYVQSSEGPEDELAEGAEAGKRGQHPPD
jgi:hypothetical protein